MIHLDLDLKETSVFEIQCRMELGNFLLRLGMIPTVKVDEYLLHFFSCDSSSVCSNVGNVVVSKIYLEPPSSENYQNITFKHWLHPK